jgi:hypothetical protein
MRLKAGQGDNAKALAVYKAGGIKAVDQYVIATHCIDGATDEEMRIAHAMVKMYRNELARQYEMLAERHGVGSQSEGCRKDDLAKAERLRAHEPFLTFCDECV